MGFVGGKGHGGISDTICPRELGLYVVNTGSTGHPRDLQDKTAKNPRTTDLRAVTAASTVSSQDTGLLLLTPCARCSPYQCPVASVTSLQFHNRQWQPFSQWLQTKYWCLAKNELLGNTLHCVFSPATPQQSLHIKYTEVHLCTTFGTLQVSLTPGPLSGPSALVPRWLQWRQWQSHIVKKTGFKH